MSLRRGLTSPVGSATQPEGEDISASPVTGLADGRVCDRYQTTPWENHGGQMLPVSLLLSLQMSYRYYTSSFPSVGFACTCYNLIRRKLDFLCQHHKKRQHKHINLSLKFLFLLFEMPEDCPVNQMCNSILHNTLNNGSSLSTTDENHAFSEIHSLLHEPQILQVLYISTVINPCNAPVHDTIHLDHQFS